MRKTRIATYALLLGLAGTASAETAYDMIGAGFEGCGRWLKTRSNLAQRRDAESLLVEGMLISWSQGFLTGLNVAHFSAGDWTPKLPTGDTIRAYLDKHCQANPLDTVMDASAQLMADLGKR